MSYHNDLYIGLVKIVCATSGIYYACLHHADETLVANLSVSSWCDITNVAHCLRQLWNVFPSAHHNICNCVLHFNFLGCKFHRVCNRHRHTLDIHKFLARYLFVPAQILRICVYWTCLSFNICASCAVKLLIHYSVASAQIFTHSYFTAGVLTFFLSRCQLIKLNGHDIPYSFHYTILLHTSLAYPINELMQLRAGYCLFRERVSNLQMLFLMSPNIMVPTVNNNPRFTDF